MSDFPGCVNETLLVRLDLAGVAASAGSACQSGASEVSHVLEAMGLSPAEARESVRFSFGWNSTAEEAEEAADDRHRPGRGAAMRALVAMSGGVDSSVAAALMREAGHDVVGVTLKLWSGPNGEAPTAGCCTVSDAEDARRVAAQLDIPYYVLDYTDEFRDGVVDRFVQDYGSGRTPNPCIECNRTVKFDRLLNGLADFETEVLVTGHHARNRHIDGGLAASSGGGSRQGPVVRALHADPAELSRESGFPVGELTKTEVRSIAAEMGLRTADKPESMDICFVGQRDYRGFLAR